eukprot:Nk52_evm1s1051 gene=Nk52_evmTU1s1051
MTEEVELTCFVVDNFGFYLCSEVEKVLNKPAGSLGAFYPNVHRRYASDIERQFLVTKNMIIVRAADVNAIIEEDDDKIEYLKKPPKVLELLDIKIPKTSSEDSTEAEESSGEKCVNGEGKENWGSADGTSVEGDEDEDESGRPKKTLKTVKSKLDEVAVKPHYSLSRRQIIQPKVACLSSEPLLTTDYGDGGMGGDAEGEQMLFSEREKSSMINYSKQLCEGWKSTAPEKKRRMIKYPNNPYGKQFKFVGLGQYYGEIKRTADMKEILIPIKVDIEQDGYKLVDTFVWNANDSVIRPEVFAKMLCMDLNLPENIMKQPIVEAIEQQINEHRATAVVSPAVGECLDRRVLIKLNVRVGVESLEDQFEWDLTDPENSPEEFARILCKDLNLGGEFCTAIAHSIREQLAWHNKAFLQGQYLEDEMPTVSFPPFRELYNRNAGVNHVRMKLGIVNNDDNIDQWGPVLKYLTEQDLERIRMAQERENRRLRRSTAAGSRKRYR